MFLGLYNCLLFDIGFLTFQGLNRLVKDVYDLPLSVADDGMLVRLNNKQYETYQGPVIISNYTCRIRALGKSDIS